MTQRRLRRRSNDTASVQKGLLVARPHESLGFVREGELARRIKLRSGYANDICMALFVDSSVP